MTTTETTGAGGSGDDEQPKQTPEKDKEAVKEEVVATANRTLKRKEITLSGRGGPARVANKLFQSALGGTGMSAQKPTEENKQRREKEGKQAREKIAEDRKSIEDEFWDAIQNVDDVSYRDGASRHLDGGEAPDRPTIGYFRDKSMAEWLASRNRSDVELTRKTNEKFGKGINFTVYFVADGRDRRRRSVGGYVERGRVTIVHIGPIQ